MKKLISVLVVLVVVSTVHLTLAGPAQAATQIFVKIGDIKGQSTDDRHREWIDATDFADKVAQPGGSTLSTGTRTGGASFNDILIAKKMDIASPLLFDLCASGKHVPSVQIDFVETTARGKVVVATYELTNVMVSSVVRNFNPQTGDVVEQVTLNFGKIKQVFYDPRGGKIEAGWDVARNTAG